jgi:predicted DNA-binding transcriptional regulator YafY
LALALAGTRSGLTLDEMAAALGVSRRTAERLLDALKAVFPRLAPSDDEARVRRWWLPGDVLAGVVRVRAEVVAAVEGAARDSAGDADRAALLTEGAALLRAMMDPAALARTETDLEGLMQAEGSAMRPGPRQVVADGVLPALRQAMLGFHPVALRYDGVDRVICPHGVLRGGRGYLVGHVEGLPEMRLWRLDRIASVAVLDRSFVRQAGFDLAGYAARSFGVFQEEPMDVVLRFEPWAAEEAAGWVFHPTQTMERDADGGLVVKFTAGGVREMCWHLFTWGMGVRVLAPEGLRVAMREIAGEVMETYATSES